LAQLLAAAAAAAAVTVVVVEAVDTEVSKTAMFEKNEEPRSKSEFSVSRLLRECVLLELSCIRTFIRRVESFLVLYDPRTRTISVFSTLKDDRARAAEVLHTICWSLFGVFVFEFANDN